MSIQVELRVADNRVQRLPDPAGGFFDAAGDFDRLVSRRDPALKMFGRHRAADHIPGALGSPAVRSARLGLSLFLGTSAAAIQDSRRRIHSVTNGDHAVCRQERSSGVADDKGIAWVVVVHSQGGGP